MLPPYFLKLSLIPALQVLLINDFILWFCNGNSRHSITYSLQNKIRMQLRGLFHPISIAFSHHQKLSVDFSRDYSSLHSLYKYIVGIIVNLYPHVNPFFQKHLRFLYGILNINFKFVISLHQSVPLSRHLAMTFSTCEINCCLSGIYNTYFDANI